MQGVSVEFKGLSPFVSNEELKLLEDKVYEAHDMINNKSGAGRNMLGWFNLPNEVSDEEVKHILEASERIKKQADVFVVIGIGGSYLGAKAIIDIFSNTFSNMQSLSERKHPEIIFAGNNLSGKYLRDLIEYLSDKDFAINVISKSGRTLEPAVTFRALRILLEEKYGIATVNERIYVTTDSETGLLKEIAEINNYETFTVPRNVGGRYSVLTAVGLLPMAVANIDIRDILDGAIFAQYSYNQKSLDFNECYKYAAYRNILNQKGKDIEIMASYEPSFSMFSEWFKQLFGESEGKDGKGIFPASVTLTTDLHSMGQMIQDGKRNIFETIINIEKTKSFISMPYTDKDEDKLNYLAGMEIDEINKKAFLGTTEAHVSGLVPCIVINLEEVTEYNIGQLIYFFEKACAISAYILGVNPFDQPGVEEYKNNMMRLLNEK